MKKHIYHIEFVLQECPVGNLWDLIATGYGLGQWFADDATKTDDDQIVFRWGDHEQIADIRNIKQGEYIRLHWQDDPERQYFELRMTKSELTNQVTLRITDFATEKDMDDEKQLWEHSISQLCRVLGIVE